MKVREFKNLNSQIQKWKHIGAELLSRKRLIVFLVSYLGIHISFYRLNLALEDYIQDKQLDRFQIGNKLRAILQENSGVFVSEGKLTEKLKPYLLPFLPRRKNNFKNREDLG